MRNLFIILHLICFSLSAQDKLFLSNGSTKKGFIVSKAKDFIYFRTSDTAAIEKIDKTKILLIEDYKGNRYLFSSQPSEKGKDNPVTKKEETARNIISVQPIALLLGRATLVYERLSEDGKIGLVIPFSVTFDPFGTLYDSGIDTNNNSIKRISGVNFIAGADLNFYLGEKRNRKFFIGPRFRYGTDLFLRDVEGYSLQTQLGWKLNKPERKVVQHLSLGFGFVRVLSSPAGKLIDPKQSYPWFSLNYRIGLKW